MDKINPVKILLLVSLLIFLVALSYIVGVGIIGKGEFSLTPKSWESFSIFFTGMLSPILAAIAAATAFFSLTYQLKVARQDTSLNEQIANYLNNIQILQSMIDKRWKTVSKITQVDWEEELYDEINLVNIKNRLQENINFTNEIIVLFRLFEDLVQAVQWYTFLHKSKIDLNNQNYPRNEWSHFSKSLIREQDKKMKFCYEYCTWILNEKESLQANIKNQTELHIYSQFYENLLNTGDLYKQ